MRNELTSAEGGDADDSWTSCAAEALLVARASPPMLRNGGGSDGDVIIGADVEI